VTETSTRRRRNRRGTGDRLREEIIVGAIAVADRADDPGGLTLRAIARETGIAAPSIYRHFADIDAILDAVVSVSFSQLTDLIDAAVAPVADPHQAFLVGCHVYVEFGRAHRVRYQLMTHRRYVNGPAFDVFSRLTAKVEPDQPDHTEALKRAGALWMGLHGLALWPRHDEPSVWERAVTFDDVIETLVAALYPRH
jgi:AcrR family transcriptional regulator